MVNQPDIYQILQDKADGVLTPQQYNEEMEAIKFADGRQAMQEVYYD